MNSNSLNSSPSELIATAWLEPQVADAQRTLVVTQLADEARCAPFAAFLRAMDAAFSVEPDLWNGVFLDVGCGVGHYGVLCRRHYPHLHYLGSDVSAAMLVHARILCPEGFFTQCSFFENVLAGFDLVLIGQVMEMTADPRQALDWVLAEVRSRTFVIFHRLRLTDEPAEQLLEKTYCDLDSPNYLWNRAELMAALERAGIVHYVDEWENTTIVWEKR